MICQLCKEDKLSKEFPFSPLTEKCDHPLLHCLDCVTASVKKKKICSQCPNSVEEDNEVYQEYLETLNFLFPTEEDDRKEDDRYVNYITSGNIVITNLSGESATIPYHPLKKISDVKREVEQQLKTPPENQRLLFQNKELKARNDSHELLTLRDHKVPANSTVHLVIILCAVPEELDHVVFDFYWRLPYGRLKDYLDVSVLAYSGREYLGVIFYRFPSISICPGVTHSGPADMDYIQKEGHQRVDVFLKSVSPLVDKLVFTLSAWGSPTIAEYPYYRLRFYDVNFPEKQLCSDKVSHLKAYKSVIMCCLSKIRGRWEALSVRVGSGGFTRNYWPLKEEIGRLIRQGFLSVPQ